MASCGQESKLVVFTPPGTFVQNLDGAVGRKQEE